LKAINIIKASCNINAKITPKNLCAQRRNFFVLLCLCTGLLLKNSVAAQTATTLQSKEAQSIESSLEDIYRIELLVFTNNSSYSDEQWPKRPEIGYPDKLLFLKQPLPADPLLTTKDDTESLAPSITADTTLQIEPESSIENHLDLLPPLLEKLPSARRTLNQSAAAINRRNAYSVLFHEAWIQQLESPDSAGALVITGGESFGNHNVLEGSVTFSKKRFLHINTNLWLNEFDTAARHVAKDEWQHYYGDSIILPDIPTAPPVIEIDSLSTTSTDPATDTDRNYDETNTGFLAFKERSKTPDFIVNRAYTLKEYRRIKRDEEHYLDHPKFGLIVTISKYVPDATDAED